MLRWRQCCVVGALLHLLLLVAHLLLLPCLAGTTLLLLAFGLHLALGVGAHICQVELPPVLEVAHRSTRRTAVNACLFG